jgi:glycosyltransferase involved in cell wall biosynthesis
MISLISTVKNEAGNIDRFLESVFSQTRAPDEFVVCDGGSSDGTAERIQSFSSRGLRLRLIIEPRANISRGRNLAIREARGDILAITDAGCRLEPDWLEEITRPFCDGRRDEVDVVCGYSAPWAETFFQKCLAIAFVVLPEETPVKDLMPSSRCVAVRRTALERAGGYPEWLDIAEDMYLDRRLKQVGARFLFAPDAVVHWEQQRDSRGVCRQFSRYARWDAQAGVFPRIYVLRFLGYFFGAASVVAGFWHPLAWLGFLGLIALRLRRPLRRIRRYEPAWGPARIALAIAVLAYLVVLIDSSRMIGYVRGQGDKWRKPRT